MRASTKRTDQRSEFVGKRVLVTGGTKGAGKAIADPFLQGGATVAITARSAPAENTPAHFIKADVSTTDGTSAVIREMLGKLKGVDIVVHNVGGSSAPSGGFITVTDELWQQAINENLFPAVRLDRGLLPSMIERSSGVIIHISSIQRTMTRFLPSIQPCSPNPFRSSAMDGADVVGEPGDTNPIRLGWVVCSPC
jgi:NAD(P)-dependent dehydrogenase (short-subunit alcohol dehydrogenase family)